MKVVIRRATRDDIVALCQLVAEGDSYHADALPSIFARVIDATWRAPFLRDRITDDESAVFVADAGGKLAGAVIAILRRVSPEVPVLVQRRYAWVDTLVVKQAYRRRGLGRALMEHVHRWAVERGVNEVELNVWEFNEAAISLYTQLGYATASRRMRLVMSPGHRL